MGLLPNTDCLWGLMHITILVPSPTLLRIMDYPVPTPVDDRMHIIYTQKTIYNNNYLFHVIE